MAEQAKKGDKVKVHYHGRLSDGSTFDSSAGRQPLEFEVGSGMVIKGFDDGVTGMAVGEKKTVTIPSDDAYGPRQEAMVIQFPKSNFPNEIIPEIGMTLQMHSENGQEIPVVITAISDDAITLDANHPLAGKELIFDIELVDLKGNSPLIIIP
ncbi:MAG: peptidylprolyl isomerase [Bacteroidetes bacterium]|nr:peptidylprolyl isomerase [Bacteroidota bacterium]